jgi:predicted transcriptional regulator
MLFGKDGKLLYSGAGKFTENQIQQLLKIIRDELLKN